jgi:hypothetical protein
VRSNALPAFERTIICGRTQACVRPQITAVATKADMVMRSTAGHLRSNAYNCLGRLQAACDRGCYARPC